MDSREFQLNKVFKETSKVVKDVKGKFTNHMH